MKKIVKIGILSISGVNPMQRAMDTDNKKIINERVYSINKYNINKL